MLNDFAFSLSSGVFSVSLVEWTADNKFKFLKEFGCKVNNYNPYQNGDTYNSGKKK